MITDHIWSDRFEYIRAFERHLGRNGTVIRKVYLNISKEEQRRRFLKRLNDPEKQWKFSEDDLRDRERWDEYYAASQDMVRQTATSEAPWFVVPADRKWFARLAIADILIDALGTLNLKYPEGNAVKQKEIAAARNKLLEEPS